MAIWHPDFDRKLTIARSAGVSNVDLSERFNVSRTTIKNHVRKLALPRRADRAWTDEDDDIVIDGVMDGLLIKEIAAKLKRTRSAVSTRICRLKKRKLL